MIFVDSEGSSAQFSTAHREMFIQLIKDIKMSIRKTIIVGALASLCAVAAQAQSTNKTPGAGPNPFTDCGIGAALFPETHWAAVTSNVIWDIGTTAVTSATLSPQTCAGKKVATALFIRDSYERLAEETAQGEGEHLATLLNMFECQAGSHSAAITETRSSMGAVVSQPSFGNLPRLDKAARFYDAVQSAVTKSCAA